MQIQSPAVSQVISVLMFKRCPPPGRGKERTPSQREAGGRKLCYIMLCLRWWSFHDSPALEAQPCSKRLCLGFAHIVGSVCMEVTCSLHTD